MLQDQEAKALEEKLLLYKNKVVGKWINSARNGELLTKKVKPIDLLEQLDQSTCFQGKRRKVLEIGDDFDIVFIIYFQIYIKPVYRVEGEMRQSRQSQNRSNNRKVGFG